MRGLQHRLKRLENPREDGACPVCRPDGYAKLRVEFSDDDAPDDDAASTCPRCGRSLVLRLTFDDRAMEMIPR